MTFLGLIGVAVLAGVFIGAITWYFLDEFWFGFWAWWVAFVAQGAVTAFNSLIK